MDYEAFKSWWYGPHVLSGRCTCSVEYLCRNCGSCLVHTHQQVWRLSEGREDVRRFKVESATKTFVNEGWDWTVVGMEAWFWYRRVPNSLSADCWVRAC